MDSERSVSSPNSSCSIESSPNITVFEESLKALSLLRFNEPDKVFANEKVRQRTHRLCKQYLGGCWRKAKTEDLTVKSVTGGLSNLLYYCALPGGADKNCGEPHHILMRIYAQAKGTDAEDCIIAESVICTLLAERGIGPKLYGVFSLGRIEEFIEATPLTSLQIQTPELSKLIACQLGQVHALRVPLTKNPTFIFDNITRWTEVIYNEQALLTASSLSEELLTNEIEWLTKAAEESQSPVVFCHNDLQGGNILRRNCSSNTTTTECEGKLIFIDFEYSSYNYRGFDIANHFCEYIFDYNHGEPPYFLCKQDLFPSEEKQLIFIKEYLKSFKAAYKDHLDSKYLQPEQILKEVRLFALASHFLWTLWSLFNAATSKITFDYVEYARRRFQLYKELKESYMKVHNKP